MFALRYSLVMPITAVVLTFGAISLATSSAHAVDAQSGAQSVMLSGARNTSAYNLNQGIGLSGYDPVAVFAEGGGQAQAGVPSLAVEYRGVTYLFASSAHLELFKATPDKYEPTYGGWCAYAMASGSKVEIQPTLFTIHGNRAHYFVAARAKKNFDADLATFEQNADTNWKQISGEEPRL